MPDKHRRAELPPLDEDTRAEKEPWLGYAILLGFLVIAIVIALFVLRPGHDLFSDLPGSISNAPGA